MSSTTPRSALPLLAAAQSQKHVTHNEALLQADALLCCNILDRDLSAPPSTPADGDTYLVKATGTAAWAGQDGNIAFAVDGGWRFYAPYSGLVAYVAGEQKLIVFDGSAWLDYASLLILQNVPELGVNATADSANKFTVASAAVLFNNIGAGVQAKLNKNTSADTASLLYQTNFSGRAEIGLTGDDNFHFKVSPDGAMFYEALILNRNTGSQLLKHVDVTSATTLGAAHLGRMVRADASGGAFNVTLPATADADDWVIVRKKDSGANKVTVKNSGGADMAWLSAQYDEAMFAFWDGAWSPVRWKIAPIKNVFTSGGTWTKAPLASHADVTAIGAGGGGGGGRRGAAGTARSGGIGGQPGVVNRETFRAALVGASETVTVGTGGAGATAALANDTDGSTGTDGTASAFGTHLVAKGGKAGAGGASAAVTANQSLIWSFRGATAVVPGNSSVTAQPAQPIDSAGPGAGGAGGGITSGDVELAGGNGGTSSIASASSLTGGAGGVAGGSGGVGGAGTDVTDTDRQWGGSGGGGGGGTVSTHWNGGNGGAPGGGGGGGGGVLDGHNGSQGGNGARGEIRVTTYF